MRPSARTLLSVSAVLGLAFLAGSAPAQAGGTKKQHLHTFDHFDDGDTEGAAIEGSGKITVGYTAQGTDLAKGNGVFSCLADGKDLLVGTSDVATITRLRPGKKDTLEQELMAELPGVVVTAIAPLEGGDFIAATLPGGTIHRVSKKGKQYEVSEFAKLDVERIWALRVHEGKVYAATGPRGELWAMGLDGKDPKVVLDVDDKDLLTMLPVGKDLVVGSSPKAKLYQVTDDKEGLLLHDFKGNEVRALALTNSGLLVAVNEFKKDSVSSADNLTKQLNRASLTGEAPKDTSVSGDKPKADATLYHVDLGPKLDLARAAEATWEAWLEKSSQYFTDLVTVDNVGTALVSSSLSGKVYRVRGRRDVATVADLDERQATALCRVKGGEILAGATDGAAVYRLLGPAAAKARYVTKVYEADQPSDYGRLVVRGKGKIGVRARSGPGEEPDGRWSEWKTVGLEDGPDGLEGELAVPRRRYFQLEVELGSDGSEVRDLQWYYAPENLAPKVSEVDIKGPSFSTDDDKEPKPEAKIKWDAEAVDDDDLVYEVSLRPEGAGDDQWMRLHDEPHVTSKELELDLTSVPDGVYEARVIASDEPANGTDQARTDELTSAPFVVDRTRPKVEDLTVDKGKVLGRASDEGSRIHDVAVSIDGGEFRPASPRDGLYDTEAEGFAFTLPTLQPGKHRLVIRARDDHGNIGTRALFVPGQ